MLRRSPGRPGREHVVYAHAYIYMTRTTVKNGAAGVFYIDTLARADKAVRLMQTRSHTSRHATGCQDSSQSEVTTSADEAILDIIMTSRVGSTGGAIDVKAPHSRRTHMSRSEDPHEAINPHATAEAAVPSRVSRQRCHQVAVETTARLSALLSGKDSSAMLRAVV